MIRRESTTDKYYTYITLRIVKRFHQPIRYSNTNHNKAK